MAEENTDVRDLLDLTPEDVAESQQHAALDLAATKKAAAILRKSTSSRVADRSAVEILGEVDAMKFRSCLTLFDAVAPGEPCFANALQVFYDGKPDAETLRLLGPSAG